MATNLRAAWAKANNYYSKLDLSPAYYAATILHPYYGTYCDIAWADKPNWLNASNSAFHTLWAQYNTSLRAVQRPKVLFNDMDDAIDGLINPTTASDNEGESDEYKRWRRNEPRAETNSEWHRRPINYWLALRDRYLSLSMLAIDVLSIPASSCKCERMISELGDLLEPCRRRIKPQLFAAIQCV